MPWRVVSALTRALLCGDSRWFYRPLSGLGWYGNGRVAVDVTATEKEGEVRACSGFHGGASLLLRQNDQQHVLQDALALSDDHDHPSVSPPSFHHVSSRQVVSHAAAPSDSRAMRCASARVTW